VRFRCNGAQVRNLARVALEGVLGSHLNGRLVTRTYRKHTVARNDRLLLPILKPKVSGNPTVMLVDVAVALAPAVELGAVMSSHTMNRPPPISVFSDQRRTKSTIWSRVSCGSQTPVRVPQLFF
jgi:hypothetical protein